MIKVLRFLIIFFIAASIPICMMGAYKFGSSEEIGMIYFKIVLGLWAAIVIMFLFMINKKAI